MCITGVQIQSSTALWRWLPPIALLFLHAKWFWCVWTTFLSEASLQLPITRPPTSHGTYWSLTVMVIPVKDILVVSFRQLQTMHQVGTRLKTRLNLVQRKPSKCRGCSHRSLSTKCFDCLIMSHSTKAFVNVDVSLDFCSAFPCQNILQPLKVWNTFLPYSYYWCGTCIAGWWWNWITKKESHPWTFTIWVKRRRFLAYI